MNYDANLLARFLARPKPLKDSTWSLWRSLSPTASLYTRVHHGARLWAWGANPYTCPAANVHRSEAEAVRHYAETERRQVDAQQTTEKGAA